MLMELSDIKKAVDKAYERSQITRERAADDLVFFWITQWDDNTLSESQLSYRGQFDMLRKAGRAVIADLSMNPVQVDFEPEDEEREDSAEVLDGMYRRDDNKNYSREAYGVAQQEAIVCGVSAWELYTDYETRRGMDTKQIIKRRPIFEANNVVFWDPDAQMLDKSDADYVCVLRPYTKEGIEKLTVELTGDEDYKVAFDNFKNPEHSYVFPWAAGESEKFYVGEFYKRELVEETVFTLENPFGDVTTVSEVDFDEDELIEGGYEIVSEKTIERYRVFKYVCTGEKILNGEWDESEKEGTGEMIAGEHLPIVPMYGERAYIEGEEHWEGITRLAKDPQRLRNFQLSYLADISSRSPREKPIFFPEQIAGYEDMYSLSGSENNYAFVYANKTDDDGNDLPIGQVATLPAPNIPQALAALIDVTAASIQDVANPGLPQDISDPDVSGKAVLALQAKLDMQSVVYQENFKHAKRRDGEIYASMASEVYDVPRKVKLEMPDGTKKTVQVMETILTSDGELKVINDINNQEFHVWSKIGPSYSSQKEQTLERMETMMQALPPGDPMRQVLMLKSLKLTDGVDFDDIRDYANKQLVLMGIKEPETDEEKQLVAQAAQQGEEQTAEMVLAQAEMLKGQAANREADFKMVKLQAEMGNEGAKRQIDAFKAETDRGEMQIDAQEAGAKIDNTRADTLNKQIDSQTKLKQLRAPSEMETGELLQELFGT
jgi:hypothetical protein